MVLQEHLMEHKHISGVLEGLFGPTYKIIRTDELMKKGYLSKLNIKVLTLKHPARKFENYEDEIQYLITHTQRNNFIKNLTLDQKEIHSSYIQELSHMVFLYLIS